MVTRPTRQTKRGIESYVHEKEKRVNNPPVGLVKDKRDPSFEPKQYEHDPHIDPQLNWAGKTEGTSFEVPTVSLHVHERIDPRTIIEAVCKRGETGPLLSLFDKVEENPPLRQAIDFYKHRHNWCNRLVAGDSLLVMNSLLEKEGLGGKVQTVYIDPPYGIRYGSNFQPFVNRHNTGEDSDGGLTGEPEQIRAFRDTWELGVHSYLTYLRDRLLLARELLRESGSCFVQIGDENVHRVGAIMDEIFGSENRVATISYVTTGSSSSSTLSEVADYLLWYAKDKNIVKYRQLYEPLSRPEVVKFFNWHVMVEVDGKNRPLTVDEKNDPDHFLPKGARIFRRMNLHSRGTSTTGRSDPYKWNGRVYKCPTGSQWRVSVEGLNNLASKELDRLVAEEGQKALMWKLYEDEVPGRKVHNIWAKQMSPSDKRYVVQTSNAVVQRCLLMSTDPGDLVFDPTCGSGTTAAMAEKWGRRWITCDTSRVALTVARQRLMTTTYEYYVLVHPNEGIDSGFKYRSVNTHSAGSLAYGEPPKSIDLIDSPILDRKKVRVSGPFTVEAVPAPTVRPLVELEQHDEMEADITVARTNPTLRYTEWREELLKTGIRGKSGQIMRFMWLEPQPATKWLHAVGEVNAGDDSNSVRAARKNDAHAKTDKLATRVVVAFGPEHAPLEQRQVERVLEDAGMLLPKPELIVFAAFQFDPKAAKDIDETISEGQTLIKVQMNADLLTSDLKKKRSSNESFWLIGQPDVEDELITVGENAGKYIVKVKGFDYFNVRTSDVESGEADKIAIWMLDTDYDGRSLYPRQVFFPVPVRTGDLEKLAKTLSGAIDPELIEKYRGTVSLPFLKGKHARYAVKIVDDRGVESLRIKDLE